MIGLPDDLYPKRSAVLVCDDHQFDGWGFRFVKEGSLKTEYRVIIAGENFGCGSSREHAPVAMGAAGMGSFKKS